MPAAGDRPDLFRPLLDAAARAEAEPFTLGSLDAPPRRGMVVVTCMDARLDPLARFGLAPGDAHVLRNAGALVTDDVIRSITLSQLLMGTRAVLLLGHTECGLLGASEDALAARAIAATGARPAVPFGAFADLDEQVRVSVARLRTDPLLLHRDAIRGFVHDVRTGHLREVATPPTTPP